MTDSGYINRAFRPQPGRKYYNHLAKHTRGEWHRNWLLSSGQYIRPSDPDMRKGYGWKIVGEDGPELVSLQSRPACNLHWPGCGCQMEPMKPTAELDALTCHCGRIACRHHQEEP